MDRACSTQERISTIFFAGKNLKGRNNLEDLGVDGRILLEWKQDRKV
jgi:hypothetical protein